MFSDATCADDPMTQRSQSGYVGLINGCLITWKSFKQHNFTWSSTEAELKPLRYSFLEGRWLKALYSELCKCEIKIIHLNIDNSGLLDKLYVF